VFVILSICSTHLYLFDSWFVLWSSQSQAQHQGIFKSVIASVSVLKHGFSVFANKTVSAQTIHWQW
jgi:hypothetical protein